QRLHLLFDAGMQVADHGHDALDLLAVEVDDEAEHAVGRWVVRPEVDGEQLAAEGALLAGARDCDAWGGGLDHIKRPLERSATSRVLRRTPRPRRRPGNRAAGGGRPSRRA